MESELRRARRTRRFAGRAALATAAAAVAAIELCGAPAVRAADLYWDLNGSAAGGANFTSGNYSGTWDLSLTNWTADPSGASATSAWVDGSTAVFSAGTNGAAGTISIADAVTLNLDVLRIEEGALTFARAGTGAAPVFNIGGATIDIASGRSATFVNTLITTPGGLTKTGDGTLVFNALQGYSGTTTVSGGILQAQPGFMPGLITNNASVVFSMSSNATYAGAISGGGTMSIAGITGLGALIVNTFTAAQSYTGATTVTHAGLTLSGAAGSVASSAVTLSRGNLSLLNTTNTNNDRVGATTAVLLRGGSLSLTAGATLQSNEQFGVLDVGDGGANLVTLTSGTGGAILEASSFARQTGGTLLVRGAQLGLNNATATTGTNLRFTTAPTLVGAGAVGTPSVGVLAGVIAETSATATGSTATLATYDTFGVRQLSASEYSATFSANTNVAPTANSTIAASTTINALELGGAGNVAAVGGVTSTIAAGQTLSIASGMIYSNATSASTITGSGALAFGAGGTGEAIISAYGSGAITIDSPIQASSLTKGGNGTLTLGSTSTPTFTGTTNVNQGTLVVTANNQLGSGVVLGHAGFSGVTGTANVGGSLRLSGNVSYNVPVTINGAYTTVTITPTSQASFESLTGNNTWAGDVLLAGNDVNTGNALYPSIGAVTAGSALTISGVIKNGTTRSAGFHTTGLGDIVLTGSAPNTFTSLVRPIGGRIIVEKNGAFGSSTAVNDQLGVLMTTAGNVSASTIAFRAPPSSPAGFNYSNFEWLGLGGTGVANDGVMLQNLGGANTFAGGISFGSNIVLPGLTNPTKVDIVTGSSLELAGPLASRTAATVRDIVKTGGGDLIISGDNSIALLTFSAITPGSRVVVDNGAVVLRSASPTAGNLPSGISELVLNTGGTFTLDNTLAVNANRIPGVATITAGGGELKLLGAAHTFSGTVVGAANFIVSGNSTLTLAGAAANTNTGTTTVNSGTLRLAKPAGTNAVGGDVTVNNTGTLLWAAGEQIANNATLTLNGGGTINLAGFTETVGAFVDNGGAVVLGGGGALNVSGALTLTDGTIINTATTVAGNIVYTGTTTAATISAPLSLSGTGVQQFNINDGSANPDVLVSGVIDGATGGITKSGAGTLRFTANNVYTGVTTINTGSLVVAANGALGATAGNTVIAPGGTLAFDGGVNYTTAEPVSTQGTIASVGGNNTFAGGVTLTGNATFTANAGSSLRLNGIVTGNASLTKTGPGQLTLAAANTYTGATTISGGVLTVGGSNSLGATPGSDVFITAGGTLNLGGIAAGSALNFGQKLFHIAGDGGGLGAITNRNYVTDASGNTGGNPQQNVLQRVILDADATVGSPGPSFDVAGSAGRFDIRAAQVNGVNVAQLNLNGHNLTKSGLSYFPIVNGDVVGVGDMIVEQGTLALEFTTRVLNDGSSRIIVRDGAAQQFWNNNAAGATNVTRPIEMGNGLASSMTFMALGGSTSSIGSPVLLKGDLTVRSTVSGFANNSLTLTGNITQDATPRKIIKDNVAELRLAGTNTFTGGLDIVTGPSHDTALASGNGTVQLNSATALHPSNVVSFSPQAGFTGIFRVNGFSQTVAGIRTFGAAPLGTSIIENFSSTPVTFTVDTAGNHTYAGIIRDDGGAARAALALTKTGVGALTLAGTSTYTGMTTVNGGTLQLAAPAGSNNAVGANVTVNSGGTIRWLANEQIGNAAILTLNSGGTLDLNGFTETVGSFIDTGGTTVLGGGQLNVNGGNLVLTDGTVIGVDTSVDGDIIYNGATTAASVTGNLLLGDLNSPRTINVNNGSADPDVTISGAISGQVSVLKIGGGTLALSGTNTFGGSGHSLTINGGTLRVGADSGFGDAANAVTINGAALNVTATFTTARAMALNPNTTIDVNAGAALTTTGAITGATNLTKTGGGTFAINGTTTHTGALTVAGGTFAFGGTGAMTPASVVVGNVASSTAAFAQSAGTHTIAGTLVLGDVAGANGTYDLGPAGSLTVPNLNVGSAGTGTFTQTGGTVSGDGSLHVGNVSTGVGHYALSGGSVTFLLMMAGFEGSGTFVQSGGTHTVTSNLFVADRTGSTGRYQLTAGTLATAGGFIGNFGNGTFVQGGGTHTVTGTLRIGALAGSLGRYDLGAGSLSVGGSLQVGHTGTGTFIQTGGTVDTLGQLQLGSSDGTGTYELQAGSITTGNQFTVGWGSGRPTGAGTFTQSPGTTITIGQNFNIGGNGSSTIATTAHGHYNMLGGQIDQPLANAIWVIGNGLNSTGTFNQSGGTASIVGATSTIDVGRNLGHGKYNLSGGGVINANALRVGFNGTGTFTQSGGNNAVSGGLTLGDVNGSTGIYTLSGGTLTSATTYVGNAGAGSFTQSGGTNTINGSLVIANLAGSAGNYTINGGALNARKLLLQGGGGRTASFTASGASTAVIINHPSSGAIEGIGGTIGATSFSVLGGAKVRTQLASGWIVFEGATGDTVNVSVDGAGSELSTAAAPFAINSGGTASLNISNGGQVLVHAGEFWAGNVAGKSANVQVSGADSLLHQDHFFPAVIGGATGASATLLVNNNGRAEFSDVNVGAVSNSQGSITTATGGVLAASALYIGGSSTGSGGTAIVSIGSGSSASVTNVTQIWNGGTLQLDGPITTGLLAGPGTLRKVGSSTVTLTAPNATANNGFTGPVEVVGGGTLRITAASVLGPNQVASISPITLDGGTLENTTTALGASFVLADRSLIIGPGGGTVTVTDPNNALLYGQSGGVGTGAVGAITGAGNTLTKNGPGEFRTTGPGMASNNFAKLVVNEGLYRLGTNQVAPIGTDERTFGAVPATFMADQITLNGGAIGATLNTTLNANRGITITAAGGSFISTPVVAGPFAFTIPGAISGPGSLTIQGNGTTVLAGANTYTGSTRIGKAGSVTSSRGGLLRLGALNTLPTATMLTFDTSAAVGAPTVLSSLELGSGASAHDQTVADIALAGGPAAQAVITNPATVAATFTVNNATANTWPGVISGNLNLRHTGAGDLILTGATNSFTGTIINESGVLRAVAAGALPSGVTVGNNGAVELHANATLGAVSGSGSTTIGAAATPVTVTAARFRQSALTISAGSTAVVSPDGGSDGISDVSLLALAGSSGAWTGKFDITDNGVVVRHGVGLSAATLGLLTDQVRSGLNLSSGALWSGAGGITSTTAAANPTELMAIGLYSNQDGRFVTYGGMALGPDAIVLEYTQFGDANLDGLLNLTDLAALETALATPGATGWQNGDFNYDGVIDRDNDYSIWIDSFFAHGNEVTPAISAAMDRIESLPVPEPTGVVMLSTAAAMTTFARRRRRRSPRPDVRPDVTGVQP